MVYALWHSRRLVDLTKGRVSCTQKPASFPAFLVYDNIDDDANPKQEEEEQELGKKPGTQKTAVSDLEFFASLLRSYAQQGALSDGKCLHSRLMESGDVKSKYLENLVLDMYCKCCDIDDAEAIFSKMHHRDVFCWNIMITTYVQIGFRKKAFQLFQQLCAQDVEPNKYTFAGILTACTDSMCICKWIHTYIIILGHEHDVVIGTALLNAYSKCGIVEEARALFDKMHCPSIFSWTTMITGYAQLSQYENSLLLFPLMQQQSELPNKVTFIALLDACAGVGEFKMGVQLFARIMGSEIESDVVVGTTIVNLFAKCNKLQEACKAFDRMPIRNVVSWNSMLAGYAQNGDGWAAIEIFNEMQSKNVQPDKATFVSVLDACASIAALDLGLTIHTDALHHIVVFDVVLTTALVNMYGKSSSLNDALQMFDAMIMERNSISWCTMIGTCNQHGYFRKTVELFQQMLGECILPNSVTFVKIFDACAAMLSISEGKQLHAQVIVSSYGDDATVITALINMYGKCGDLDVARKLFDLMPDRSEATWCVMISAYAQYELGYDALQLTERMQQENILVDKVSLVCAIGACAIETLLIEGMQLHSKALIDGHENDVFVSTALVNMYGSCGSIESAQRLFDTMPSNDVICWNALITVYAQYGHGIEAMKLFHQMQVEQEMPDEITFVNVLNACSRAGLVRESHYFLESMNKHYGVHAVLDHYNCMIDVFGRAGLLEEAEMLIYKMPCEPIVVSWMTLLGGCRYQADEERGQRALSKVLHLDPKKATPNISLSRICAAMSSTSTSFMTSDRLC